MQVAICIGCVTAKQAREHKFPIICPKLGIPCLAIRPDFVDDEVKREQMVYRFIDGIPCNECSILDEHFISEMGRAEKKLIQDGYIVKYMEGDE